MMCKHAAQSLVECLVSVYLWWQCIGAHAEHFTGWMWFYGLSALAAAAMAQVDWDRHKKHHTPAAGQRDTAAGPEEGDKDERL